MIRVVETNTPCIKCGFLVKAGDPEGMFVTDEGLQCAEVCYGDPDAYDD